MDNARWRGSRELAESPDSPQWDFNDKETICTRTLLGPYNLCLKSRPERGAEMSGFEGLAVDRSSVKKAKGGIGTLTIIATGSPADASSETLPALEYKWEIEWERQERALILHPMYSYDGGGEHLITPEQMPDIERWEDCPDSRMKKDFKYYPDKNSTGTIETLEANPQHYAAKRLRGVESYLFYHPIARKTTTQRTAPTTGNCGKTDVPDRQDDDSSGFGDLLPTGYEWLKTSDRATKSGKHGKYERTEEWTGAELWDEDLYPPLYPPAGDARASAAATLAATRHRERKVSVIRRRMAALQRCLRTTRQDLAAAVRDVRAGVAKDGKSG